MEDLPTIVGRARSGDLAAYSTIVRRYQDMAVGYAHSVLDDFHLAEDAAQEAFVEAHGCLADLRQPQAFAGWLRKIVFKHCDRLRRRRHRSAPLEEVPEAVSADPDPVQRLEAREFSSAVEKAVRALPEGQRQVVTLFYMGGYSHREIAAFLGVESRWVNNRLYTARKRLKEEMLHMVQDNLHHQRPSRDQRFARLVAGRVAVEAGQLEQVKKLVDRDGGLVSAKDGDGQTLLHRAAYRGQGDIARLLLECGAQVNAGDGRRQTPLHRLSYVAQAVDVARLLLEHGADIDACDADGQTPLQVAALNIDSLRQGTGGPPWWYAVFLVDQGARPDVFSATVLELKKGQILRQLLAADPDLVHARHRDSYLPDGWTPLHHAADRGQEKAAQILIDAGADLDACDEAGQTPLYRAALSMAAHVEREFDECHGTFDLLVERGATTDAFVCGLADMQDRLAELLAADPALLGAGDAAGNTVLHLAARSGKGGLVGFLLEQGADPNRCNQASQTPLDLAVEGRGQSVVHLQGEHPIAALLEGMRETVESLMGRGADCRVFTAAALAWQERLEQMLEADPALLEGPGTDGRSLLRHTASQWQWLGGDALKATVEGLLERGTRPDIWTGAALGRRDLVDLCLTADPPLLHAFDQGLTPLHCAAMAGAAEMVDLLLERGASPHSRGRWGGTPLHLAAWAGQAAAVGRLLAGGAHIEATAAHLNTALTMAAWRGQREVVDVLLERGANVEATASYGSTPLGAAIMANHEAIALTLAGRGADLTVLDYSGGTPLSLTGHWGNGLLHWAARRGERAIVEAIVAQGGEVGRANRDGQTPLALATAEGHETVAQVLRGAA